MRIAIVLMCFIVTACTKTGPAGPRGAPGANGEGYEFDQFGGSVPVSGLTTLSLHYLKMDCPPIISVYMETTEGNWIQASVLDSYPEGDSLLYHIEFYVLHDGSMDIASISAVVSGRPTPFIVTIMAPVGYFETTECP